VLFDWFPLLVVLVLLALGYTFGSRAERRHYRSIREREEALSGLIVVNTRHVPASLGPVETRLVRGSVVISIDYFKRFFAFLRNLIGGRVSAYETLLDRARREAILRMQAEARSQGATFVFNMRLETAGIFRSTKESLGTVEVLAYGTAVIPAKTDTAGPG